MPSVLIVSTCWWSSQARLADLFQSLGCEVSILCPPGHPVLAVSEVGTFAYDAFRPIASLSRAIRASRAAVLIPADDRATAHVHRLHIVGSSEERELVEFSLGDPVSFPITRSRLEFVATARRLGIAVPDDAAIKTERDVQVWMAQYPAPWVFKIDGASNGSGVYVVREQREALSAWRRLAVSPTWRLGLKRYIVNRDGSVLGDRLHRHNLPCVSAQSFIRGRPGNLAMFCSRGEVLAISVVEAETSWGDVGPARIVRLIDAPDIVDAANRIASFLRISGFYGLDFMIEEDSGKATFIEMNPRATPLCNIRLGDGRDLIGTAVTSWFGQSIPPARKPASQLLALYPSRTENGNSPLQFSHADMFEEKPALLEAMLAPPWPNRHFFARFVARFLAWTAARRAILRERS